MLGNMLVHNSLKIRMRHKPITKCADAVGALAQKCNVRILPVSVELTDTVNHLWRVLIVVGATKRI